MAIIKCKMCGGDLELSEDMSVAVCEYCGTKQTVPKVDNEKKIKLFERANRLRKASEFDKAAGVYESIIADFDTEAEAYWGLLLCNYGIEYVDDPTTKKKVPTCHRSSFESVMKDPNLELAMENADLVAQRVYREEAKQIEELRRSIIEVSSKEEPYDVFISYKELSADGERTVDSVIAQDIYKELTAMGYRVFFSRISLESKLGTEYEPYIFAALNSARVMLVVGTDYENFNAVWVKNEWSRYLSLIARGDKKTLIPVFKDIDAYDMPEEFSKLAAQNMGKIGAMQDLLHGVEKILGGKKEEAPAAAPVQQTVAAPGVASLLERGMMFLEDRDWDSADEYFNKVLDIDPKNGEAYYGKLMVELKTAKISEIKPSEDGARKLVTSAKAYKRFGQFGTSERKAKLEARLAECDEAERIKRERKAEAARIERKREAEEAWRKAKAERIERERKVKELALKRTKSEKFGKLISASFRHTVGLRSDGTVVATVMSSKDGLRYMVSGWTDIVAISAGNSHTVALRSNGTVVAVGGNNQGQCEVSDWTDIVAISAGSYHTVGLRSDGTVVAVGDNDHGQCDVSGWTDIVAISAGSGHTVGLRSDGTVVATKYTGDQYYNRGQCSVSGWKDIVAISAGDLHTVGLRSDGTVIAVGNDANGQCKASGWTNIVAIAAGKYYTVGLHKDGTVIATKYIVSKYETYHGQCDVSGWKDVVAISAGRDHTVGLRPDGTIIATEYIGDRQYNFGERDVSGWKLFNNADTYDEDVAAAREERIAAERKAREEKIAALTEEKAKLTAELPTIKGLFAASKKEKAEARIAAIDKELAKLQA